MRLPVETRSDRTAARIIEPGDQRILLGIAFVEAHAD
jgi:hypothetical protein